MQVGSPVWRRRRHAVIQRGSDGSGEEAQSLACAKRLYQQSGCIGIAAVLAKRLYCKLVQSGCIGVAAVSVKRLYLQSGCICEAASKRLYLRSSCMLSLYQ